MSDEELIIVLVIAVLVSVLVQVFYLMTLSRTIAAIRPEFRQIEPAKVWLGMIPLFQMVWSFIINKKVIDSIQNDLEDRGMGESGDYGRQLGNIYPALRIASNIPSIGSFLSLGYLIVFIIWWTKISRYGSILQSGSGHYNDQLLDN